MLELGAASPELHRAIGRKCADLGIDWVVAVRGDARFFLEGAAEAGMAVERTKFFPNVFEAAEFCRAIIQSGDVVLVKGSRGVQMEKIIDALCAANTSDGDRVAAPPQGEPATRR
jgi:UDP-N-acetylmuramoyl-tripeptide--D-alanyl-D-alanine ligase